jgi:hypothetical protein
MIEIERIKRRTAGSCNFCRTGKITDNGRDLIYPYEHVYEISSSGGGLCARICPSCANKLKKEIDTDIDLIEMIK